MSWVQQKGSYRGGEGSCFSAILKERLTPFSFSSLSGRSLATSLEIYRIVSLENMDAAGGARQGDGSM
jgi:hypothetical protein